MAAKVRPAVVMSVGAADTDRALVTLVPHTTSARGTRFEAAVTVGFLKAGVFDAGPLGSLRQPQLAAVESAVRLWLGLEKVEA
jgi:mRNA interferase MazF